MRSLARVLTVSSCLSLVACEGSSTVHNNTPVADTAVAADTLGVDSAMPDVSTSADDVADAAPDDVADAAPCVLPARDCVGTAAYCGALVSFDPRLGAGYDDYPIADETISNQYRSYARRDLVMLTKYAAAIVACRSAKWSGGNGAPLGLGDMSEMTGAIPGTSKGAPSHPTGTHTDGHDIDVGYYQVTGSDNHLRAVCPHTTTTGADAYHCTDAPNNLDARRTALFFGALLTSDRVRVIGVDGRIGPLVLTELQLLCDDATLPTVACARKSLITYEETETGKGWFLFHHHNAHISLKRM